MIDKTALIVYANKNLLNYTLQNCLKRILPPLLKNSIYESNGLIGLSRVKKGAKVRSLFGKS